MDAETTYKVALEAIVALHAHHLPYWQDEVCDGMADLARDALVLAPSLAKTAMEPEKLGGEGNT